MQKWQSWILGFDCNLQHIVQCVVRICLLAPLSGLNTLYITQTVTFVAPLAEDV